MIKETPSDMYTHTKMTTNTNNTDNINKLALDASNSCLTLDQIINVQDPKQLHGVETGGTVLYWICAKCDDIKMIEALLDRGIDVDELSIDNWTPLMGASHNQKWETMEFLLSKGANPAKRCTFGYSPLHWAAYYNAPLPYIVKLIESGAELLAKDNDGRTPADYARDGNHLILAEYLDQCSSPIKSANLII
jgi:ankyrin repeat protein